MKAPARMPRYATAIPFGLAARAVPRDERAELIASARAGSVEAALAAAAMLFAGVHGAADLPLALDLLRGPAERGVAEAALMLGGVLWSIAGREAEGVTWLTGAAERGVAEAIYLLGLAYLRGQEVTCDLPLARALLVRAAEAGVADAQAELDLVEAGR